MSIRRWLQTTDNPLPLPKAGGDGGVVTANKEAAAVAAAQGEKRKRGHIITVYMYGLLPCWFEANQIVKINGRYLVSWAKNVKYIGR